MTGGTAAAPRRSDAVPQWTELPARPDRASSRLLAHAGAVVGAAMVVLLYVTGRTTAAAALAALVVIVTVTRLLVPAVDRVVGRALVAVSHAVGRVLSLVLLGLLGVFVLTPIWAIARVARWDSLQVGPEDPGRWARLRSRAWERLPARPYAREGRASRRRRLHGALIVALPVVLLLGVALPLRHWVAQERAGSSEAAAPEAAAPAQGPAGTVWNVTGTPPQHDGDPFIAEDDPEVRSVLRNAPQVREYDPTNLLRIRDAHAEYFNYENRTRRSWTPPTDGPMLDVWFFGSSMLFGPSIIRDDHTIASEIVRQAWEQDHIAIKASNFAIGGYETWQEMMLMAQMLTERPKPDLVVFYGGYNDLHSYIHPGAPTEVSNTWAEDFAHALDVAGSDVQPPADDTVPKTAGWDPENAARIYDRGIAMAKTILDVRGIPFVNFLQPCLWTRDRPEDRATFDSIGSDQEWHDSFGAVYDAARADIRSDVIDLSDSLDDLPGVVYWDEVHHNEAGTAAVAAAAYPFLRTQLLDLNARAATP